MRKYQIVFMLLVLGIVFISANPAPQTPQGSTPMPVISVDLQALNQYIDARINEITGPIISALEIRITNLEATVNGLEARIAELERLAKIPTATPLPLGTLAPTMEPTRTPNPTGYDCTTEVLSPYFYGEFTPGAEFLFQVRVTNSGTKTWDKNVTIQFVEGLQAELESHYAYALPVASVEPKESFDLSIMMKAPVEKKNEGMYYSTYSLNDGTENFCDFSYFIYVP
ncbi:MAG: hypothetical protein GX933_01810 [Chloroflexi bacterium]|nr:hypothetical protein [Chloroflexota bacterium]